MITTKKHWKEFRIFIKQYEKPTEEDETLANLGLTAGRKKRETEEEERFTLARICFPLEDIVDYFESYNSVKDVHGVCLTLAHGISYFVTTTYDELKAMRIEAGIEEDPKAKIEKPVTTTETW